MPPAGKRSRRLLIQVCGIKARQVALFTGNHSRQVSSRNGPAVWFATWKTRESGRTLVAAPRNVTVDNQADGFSIGTGNRFVWPGPGNVTANSASVLPSIRTNVPHPYAALPLEPAEEAFQSVLANAGATLPRRDAVDERVMKMVRTGQPTTRAEPGLAASLANPNFNERLIAELVSDVPKGIITHADQVGGYPRYAGQPYPDFDGDGLPDAWEKKHQLDPSNPSDALEDPDQDGYMSVEEFLNGTNPRAFVDYTKTGNNVDKLK